MKFKSHIKLISTSIYIDTTNWYKKKPYWTKKYLKLRSGSSLKDRFDSFEEEKKTFIIDYNNCNIWMEMAMIPVYNSLVFECSNKSFGLFIANKEYKNRTSSYIPGGCKTLNIGNFAFLKPKY